MHDQVYVTGSKEMLLELWHAKGAAGSQVLCNKLVQPVWLHFTLEKPSDNAQVKVDACLLASENSLMGKLFNYVSITNNYKIQPLFLHSQGHHMIFKKWLSSSVCSWNMLRGWSFHASHWFNSSCDGLFVHLIVAVVTATLRSLPPWCWLWTTSLRMQSLLMTWVRRRQQKTKHPPHTHTHTGELIQHENFQSGPAWPI